MRTAAGQGEAPHVVFGVSARAPVDDALAEPGCSLRRRPPARSTHSGQSALCLRYLAAPSKRRGRQRLSCCFCSRRSFHFRQMKPVAAAKTARPIYRMIMAGALPSATGAHASASAAAVRVCSAPTSHARQVECEAPEVHRRSSVCPASVLGTRVSRHSRAPGGWPAGPSGGGCDYASIVGASSLRRYLRKVRGAPGRGSSASPSRRRAMKRVRHLRTVAWFTPSRSATW